MQDDAQARSEAAAEAPVPLDEKCPKCGEQLVLRNGSMASLSRARGYPKCKYIKQNLIEGMKCPKCGKGDIAEKKARRGNVFYGCTNYPKCDFTSNYKPVAKQCPECGSPYLLEKTLKSGVYLVCPNNKKPSADEEAAPKKRARKGEPESAIACSYTKRIGDAPPPTGGKEDGADSENTWSTRRTVCINGTRQVVISKQTMRFPAAFILLAIPFADLALGQSAPPQECLLSTPKVCALHVLQDEGGILASPVRNIRQRSLLAGSLRRRNGHISAL